MLKKILLFLIILILLIPTSFVTGVIIENQDAKQLKLKKATQIWKVY
jgi:inner membrane protein involved in colicin E2 resistance